MVISPQPLSWMTVEEYLAWESGQEVRHEYIYGEVRAMTGGTIPHNDIALNCYRILYSQVRSQGCRINVADVKVQVNSDGLYYYPDVVVSCDPQDQNARQFLQAPILIIEVMSPSTEVRDRGRKFTRYQTIPSLQEYVLVNSEMVSVECYRRGEGRMWLYSPYTEADVMLLPSIGLEFPIELLYEGVVLGE
jgi:Uma2 family endonuclease